VIHDFFKRRGAVVVEVRCCVSEAVESGDIAASNGQRFLVAVRERDPNAPPINIVVNWRRC
jgi:hypothetical protein